MKRIIKNYVIYTTSLFVVSMIAEGINYQNSIQILLLAGLALTGGEFIAKPVINLMLLPLNLVTFNTFRWVSSAVVLYLITLIVQGFKIEYFTFSGITSRWIDFPPIHFENVFLSFVAFSFLLSVLVGLLSWIFK